MIYISGKDKNGRDLIASFLEEIGIGEGFKLIEERKAVDEKFEKNDVVIFVSRRSLISAMLTKDNCRDTKIILISSLIDGNENDLVGCGGIIFIKKVLRLFGGWNSENSGTLEFFGKRDFEMYFSRRGIVVWWFWDGKSFSIFPFRVIQDNFW